MATLSANALGESSPAPLRVAIVGLEHTHVRGFLEQFRNQHDAELVAIVEADKPLADRYEREFNLASNLFFSGLDEAIKATHPRALLVYTSIDKHRSIIEQGARHGMSVMVEKPLTLTLEDALAIRRVATEHKIHVLVNYETTWYGSNRAAYDLIKDGKLGALRRIVVHDGHPGPKAIGVPPEFLNWITDPARAGGGALYDFGCYGADLATWWMGGKAPLSVTAIAHTNDPSTYEHVDDDATIMLQYDKAQAVFMPSWNWPFNRKDAEVYGTNGYAITVGADRLRVRHANDDRETEHATEQLPPPADTSLHYLAAVINGTIKPEGDPSSLEINVIVMQILDAALQSARTGRTIQLKALAR